MTDAHTEVAPARRDPTLGFLVRLCVIAVPIGALLLAAQSKPLDAVVGIAMAALTLVRFPAPWTVRLTAAVLVLAPDAVVVTQLGGSPFSLRECAFVWFGLACLVGAARGELKVTIPSPLLTLVIVLIAMFGALANHRPRSLVEFAVLIVVPLVGGATIASRLPLALDFLRGVTAGTILLLGVTLTEALTNHNFLITSTALGSFVREGHIRTNAGWDYPTMLSAFLCLGGFFVIDHLSQRWRWPGLMIGGALVTAAVITTQSRSGLLGLGAGALTYLVLQRRLGQVVKVVVSLVAAAGALLLIPGAAPAGFRTFLSQSLDRGSTANANVHYRQELYQAAGAAMSHQPIWGYGWGSGKSVATNELSNYFGTLTDLASLPVSLGVQLGYVGAGAVGLLLLAVVLTLARHRDVPARLPIAAGIVGSTVAMLGVPVSPPLSWMLLIAGLGWSLHRTWRAEQTREVAETDADQAPVLSPAQAAHVVSGVLRE
jgi:O-antigen ligase